MSNKRYNPLCIAAVMLLFLNLNVSLASEASKYEIKSSSKMWFDGTSTLHDYSCQVEKFSGEVYFNGDPFASDNKKPIKNVKIKIPVKYITNEDEDLTENMHEAFELEDHPYITFYLSSSDLVSSKTDKSKVKLKGKLKVKGVTKTITMDLNLSKKGETIIVTGEKAVKMTDHKIDPPTMFLGTIRTGDEVKIKFEIVLVQK